MLASGPVTGPTFAEEQCSIAFLAKVHCSCHAENRKGGFLQTVSDNELGPMHESGRNIASEAVFNL